MTHNNESGSNDSTTEERRLILNPSSGSGQHVDQARELAPRFGFNIEETSQPGHATELAERAAIDGVDLLAACGGDGTAHEVLQGLAAADALDTVTLCVIPAGTANVCARELGITDMSDGFAVADHGETRWLDIGVAGDEPFIVSAIAGLPAEAVADTPLDLKKRVSSLAYIIEGIQETREFDDLHVEIHASTADDEFEWTGDTLAVLVGNLRHFTKEGGQADAEDGLFDVAIVEQMPTVEAVIETIEHRLFHQETPHVLEFEASRIEVVGSGNDLVTFSFDGEIQTHESATFEVRPRALQVRVGDGYVPE